MEAVMQPTSRFLITPKGVIIKKMCTVCLRVNLKDKYSKNSTDSCIHY